MPRRVRPWTPITRIYRDDSLSGTWQASFDLDLLATPQKLSQRRPPKQVKTVVKKVELPPAFECLGGATEKNLNIPVNGDCFWQRLRKFSVYHQF